jgi:Na+/proline symporter
VRVFAISIVISIILGTGEVASIVLIVCLTLFYTFEGVMTAVIWTDVVQMFLYVGGAMVSFFVILDKIPGGWEHVVAAAGAADKFRVFDFRFSLSAEFFTRPYSFWAGVIGGCFLTTASHGTEQLMVQRLLRQEQGEPRGAIQKLDRDLLPVRPVPADRVILFVYYGDAGLAAPRPPTASIRRSSGTTCRQASRAW